MSCYICGSDLSSVIDKRAVKSTGEIRRRRECLKCHNRFTTYERVCAVELYVVKRDGRKQLFSKEKLASGISRALAKRPAYEKLDEIVAKIETKIWEKRKKEVESKVIGTIILQELKKIDQVAYLRFAAVYRNFGSTSDFEKELVSLERRSIKSVSVKVGE
jgi:transcriptional repressor NrdR